MSAPYITTRESDEAYRLMIYGRRIAFVTKQEASLRFGFIADAKDIERLRKKGRPIPKDFRAAIRTASGAIVEAKSFEKYHADIVRRTSEDVDAEGYTYTP